MLKAFFFRCSMGCVRGRLRAVPVLASRAIRDTDRILPALKPKALLTAGLGDTTETFAWLSPAIEIRDPLLVYNFVNEPLLESFRRDPRGVAILRSMGLPETR